MSPVIMPCVCTADVRRLNAEFPEHTFVCYINTTAAVKAECDACVTSSNVFDIIERLPTDKIFFLPDRLIALLRKRDVARIYALRQPSRDA
jgi:quinolinate synthase